MRIQIERQRYDVHIAAALSVAEQRTLDTRGSRQEAQFGAGHARAAVVVCVQAQDHAVPALQVAVEPLDPIGVHVRRRDLDRGRQIQDHLALGARTPSLDHRITYFERVVELGAGEALGRILKNDFGAGQLFGLGFHPVRALHRQLQNFAPRFAKNYAPLQFRGGVVQMHDRALGPGDRLEGAGDQRLSRLSDDLRDDSLG